MKKLYSLILTVLLFHTQYLFAEGSMSIYYKAMDKYKREDYALAMSIFKQAYSMGDSVLSPMRIGEIYIRGLGINANESEGVRWVTIAANNNNPEAQTTMGKYYNHIGEYTIAFEWFLKAAQNGDEDGKYWLGQAFLEGRGTSQDSKKALRWTLSSALGGNPGAQWEMARAYFEGHDNPFDLDCNAEEFINWTQKAANNGLPMAQYYMGMIFLDGFNGTPVDKEKAKSWIQKAADQELSEAIITLKERF